MIYGYFDESGDKGDAFVVVAGFVGREEDWKKFLKLWQRESGGRPVHLKEMRLGSPRAVRKYADLLRRLGTVPRRANLHAFAGSVWTEPYAKRIKHSIAEIGLAGYNVALTAMVDAVLQSKRLPKRERIEFTFEDQLEFAVPRAVTLHSFRQAERYKTCPGKRSRIGRDSSMEKGPLLEASDYLSYAILQQLRDPDSQKARITSPIIEANQPIGHTMIDKENVDYLIDFVYGQEIPAMDRAKRLFILDEMRESLKR